MTYNKQILPRYVETAGKITVLTALSGILIFAFIFILNIGKTEFTKVEAATGNATTTVTVLNTPPVWVSGQEGREEFTSSTSTPTNSGNTISWVGTATDANGSPYYLLICAGAAAPSSTNNGAPTCNGSIQWGVSATTTSGQQARVSTTTTESFAVSNIWYAWVCDYDSASRCYATSSQGINATNSSPFNVNHRPTFTLFGNDGPKAPGTTITFNSTSTDPDISTSTGLSDLVFLVVCGSASYSTTTNSCAINDTVASGTITGVINNASTSRLLAAILQDTNYNAFPYIFDKFGHSATSGVQGINTPFAVSNVAPTVAGGSISIGGVGGPLGSNLILSQEATQTQGFVMQFIVADANACINAASTTEITGYIASVFRSGVGTSSCNSAVNYNNNSCYPSPVGVATWNLVCTASTTSCTGPTDDTTVFNCTFPLWFTADPTDGSATTSPRFAEHWTAGVAGVDDNNATGSMATSTSGSVELLSYVAIALQTNLIAYDQLQPGQNMSNLSASTTVRNVGNTGLNEVLYGDSMCGSYTPATPCSLLATSSTIPQNNQKYGTSSAVTYGSATGTAWHLPASSSPATLNIQIPKAIFTATSTTGTTYWGIAIPSAIQLAGTYTGQNTFIAAVSATNTW